MLIRPEFNQLAIFVEGITTADKALIPFKRGAFSVGASVKMLNFSYKSRFYDHVLNLVSVADAIWLVACQWNFDMTITELEGNYRPKTFTTWEEYAEETRKLMGEVFDMELMPGNMKDKMAMEKKVSPLKYYY